MMLQHRDTENTEAALVREQLTQAMSLRKAASISFLPSIAPCNGILRVLRAAVIDFHDDQEAMALAPLAFRSAALIMYLHGMHYADIGSGPPLVLLHGFPLDHAMWREQVAGLRGRFRVIVSDLPGFGASPPLREESSMEAMAASVAVLLDGLQLDRVVLAGFSMGGYVALAFAAQHAERLQGLVLCSSRPVADDEQARQGREATARKAEEQGMSGLAPRMAADLLAERTRQECPALLAEVEAMILRQSPQAVAAASRAMAQRPDRSALLPKLAVPSLVVTGAADQLIDPAQGARMAELMPGSRLVSVADAGHLVNLERPEAFNKAVVDFMDGPVRA